MTLEELKAEIAEILEVDPAELDDRADNRSLASWDSMAALRIISFLDDQLDEPVEPKESAALVSWPAIVEMASRRGIAS